MRKVSAMSKTLLILGLLLSVFLIGCTSFTSAPASESESLEFGIQSIEQAVVAEAPVMKESISTGSLLPRVG